MHQIKKLMTIILVASTDEHRTHFDVEKQRF